MRTKIYHIAEIAVRAMLLEVAVTPKPGLVDRANSGRHTDMDYFTFLHSTAALAPWMQACAQYGWQHQGTLPELFKKLRPLGRQAEAAMRRATGGVNTQRGLVFSMGLASAVAAYLTRHDGKIHAKKLAKQMALATRGVCARELAPLKRRSGTQGLTPGEQVFYLYGITGLRGEIEQGLPLVVAAGLPTLRAELARDGNLELAAIQALLAIMSKIADTTILHRHGEPALRQMQKTVKHIQKAGGMRTAHGRKLLLQADNAFNKAAISAGGAADMLALTLAFFYWEQEITQ